MAQAWRNIASPLAPAAVVRWLGVLTSRVCAASPRLVPTAADLSAIPGGDPIHATLPTVLPSFPAAVPAAFLGIGHLAVSQRLCNRVDRRSVNRGYGEYDESRRT